MTVAKLLKQTSLEMFMCEFYLDKFNYFMEYRSQSTNQVNANRFPTEISETSDAEKQEEMKKNKPIVGHVSMLTDMTLSNDEKYIITADRDEHVRVSRFPNGYNIESYCMGHTE
jgi:hypothetical protein